MCFHKLQFNGGKYYNKLQRERNPMKSTQIKKAINVKKLQEEGTKGTILLTHCKFVVSCFVHGKKCSLLGGSCGIFGFPPPKKKEDKYNMFFSKSPITHAASNFIACQCLCVPICQEPTQCPLFITHPPPILAKPLLNLQIVQDSSHFQAIPPSILVFRGPL